MLTPEQVTELCYCNRQDLIDPINKHWSKIARENGNKTFTIYRPTHWVSEDITEKEFIDNCISVR